MARCKQILLDKLVQKYNSSNAEMALQLNGLEAGVRRSLCWCHKASLASCGLARCRELLLPPMLHQFTPGVRTQCMSTEAAARAVSRLPDTSLREVELRVDASVDASWPISQEKCIPRRPVWHGE